MNLHDDINQLIELYQSVKRQIRQQDKHLFERWKAGGFLVDNDIISMYPNLQQIAETLEEETE